MSAARGFLPEPDPARRLPHAFAAWEEAAGELPKPILAGRIRAAVEALPRLDPAALEGGPELRRAMLVVSYLGKHRDETEAHRL